MRLNWARCVNACQHVDTQIDFGPGLTAIVGPNGSGKSNFMKLLIAGVTGNFSPLGDAKDDNFCRWAEGSEPSFIESCWETPAGQVNVLRGIRNIPSSVSIDGSEVVSGKEREVTQQAMSLLGVAPEFFSDFMFADYTALMSITSGSKVERAKLFTSLCGISIVEKLRDALRESVNVDKAILGEFDATGLDRLRQEWKTQKTRLRKLRKQASVLGSRGSWVATRKDLGDRLRVIQAGRKARQANTKELELCRDRLRKRMAAMEVAEIRWIEARCARAFVGRSLNGVKGSATTLHSRVQDALKIKSAKVAYAKAQEDLRQPAPVVPPEFDHSSQTQWQQDLAQFGVDRKSIERRLHIIGKSGSGVCPTCSQPVDVSPEHIQDLQDQIKQFDQQILELESKLSAASQAEKAQAAYERSLNAWKLLQFKAKSDLELHQKLADREISEEDQVLYRRRVRQLKDYTQEFKRVEEELQEAAEARTLQGAYFESEEAMLTKLESDRKSLKPISVKTARKVQVSFDRAEKKLHELSQIETEIASTKSIADQIQRQMRQLLRKRRQLNRIGKRHEVQQRARESCSRDRLPARVVNGMLHTVAIQVNELLAQMSVEFSVIADIERFSFTVVHSDGSKESSSRLSTGQSLCLGMAFWLARAGTFAGRLPTFCFDEPTANIDDQRLTEIAEMLSRLSGRLFAKGDQGIIVTHQHTIASSATRVADLTRLRNHD